MIQRTNFGRMRLLFLCLGAAAVLLLAACGGDDDDSTTNPTTTASSQATSPAGTTTTAPDDTTVATAEASPAGNGGGNGSDVDPCSLLTQAEVELTLGTGASEGEASNTDPLFSCQWTGSNNLDVVDVDIYSGTREEVEFYYDINTNAEDFAGLGDKAKWDGIVKYMEVLIGDYDVGVKVAIIGQSDDDAKFAASGLAERALGRLP